LKLGAQQYSFTRGSDVDRDGMFLEADVIGEGGKRTVAEVFYSDATGQFFLTCFEENVPLELVEYLIEEGRRWLPPSTVAT
jgi:hypothetical protein